MVEPRGIVWFLLRKTHPACGTDAVGVEVGDDDERHLMYSEALQGVTLGVDVLEQWAGGVVETE